VELLIPAVSPVFAFSNVIKGAHDDRGDAASLCIADKRFGKAVEQVGTLVGTFLVQCTRFSGPALSGFRF